MHLGVPDPATAAAAISVPSGEAMVMSLTVQFIIVFTPPENAAGG